MKILVAATLLAATVIGTNAVSADPQGRNDNKGRWDNSQQSNQHDRGRWNNSQQSNQHDNGRWDKNERNNGRWGNNQQNNGRWGNKKPHPVWSRGDHFRDYDRRGSVVSDYRSRNLTPPPRGHQWVQTDNNYLLVNATSNVVTKILSNSGR